MKQYIGIVAMLTLFTSLWMVGQPVGGTPGREAFYHVLKVVQ